MLVSTTLLQCLFIVGFNTSLNSTSLINLDLDGIEYETVLQDTTYNKIILSLGDSLNFYYTDNYLEIEEYLDIPTTEFIFDNMLKNITIDSFFITYTVNSFGVFDYDTLTLEYTINCTLNYSDRLGSYTKQITKNNNFNFNYDDIQPLTNTFTYDININIVPSDTASYSEGYQDGYNNGLNDGEDIGYNDGKEDGYQLGYIDGYQEGLVDGDTEESIFTFVNGVFRAVDEFLSIEIIPGIALWGIVLIPIVFGVLAFFLNLWR